MNGSVKKRGKTWYYKFRNPQINPATGKHSGLLHDQVTVSVTRPDWPVGS